MYIMTEVRQRADRNISIHRADDKEIQILLSMWIRRASTLIDSNRGMWDIEQFTVENLKRKYGNPDYYIGCINGKPFGGFILLEQDDLFWPGDRASAFYFHKFVVDESFAGQSLSKVILDWVKDYGKQHRKEYIRIDFDEDREYLKNMYYENGFRKKGSISNEDGRITATAEYCIPRE
jgi:GNAT superfamily N-acetyltransferase